MVSLFLEIFLISKDELFTFISNAVTKLEMKRERDVIGKVNVKSDG